MIRAAATMRIKWLIANIQGSSHGIYGKYHSLLPEKHPYFHSTSSFVSSLHYLMLRQKQQPPSWFVAPHLTFPAPFWVIPGCTSRTIFLRNHSIKSLFRPLVVSHCPTNKVTASHPGVQSPLKSDTCLSFHAVHHGVCTPALPFPTLGHCNSSHLSTFVRTLSYAWKSPSPSCQQSFCQNLIHPLWHN